MEKYISSSSCQFFAFNIWDIESAKAVIDAAAKLGRPLILQTSMKAFERLDKESLRNFVTEYASRKGVPAYLHLDHCRKDGLFAQAVESGWDSVMIDASEEPLERNIELTNRVSSYAHGHGVLVESEIGHVGGAEDGLSFAESGVADIRSVEHFIRNVQIDMLAVAIGTAHGQYHGLPVLHYELLEQVGKVSNLPLVIHGGSGLTDEMFKALLSHANVKKINISTDVKLAYRLGIEGCETSGLLKAEGFDPLKITQAIHDSIEDMAAKRMSLLEK